MHAQSCTNTEEIVPVLPLTACGRTIRSSELKCPLNSVSVLMGSEFL